MNEALPVVGIAKKSSYLARFERIRSTNTAGIRIRIVAGKACEKEKRWIVHTGERVALKRKVCIVSNLQFHVAETLIQGIQNGLPLGGAISLIHMYI